MAKWARLNGQHEARPVLARPKHGLARNNCRLGRHGLMLQAACIRGACLPAHIKHNPPSLSQISPPDLTLMALSHSLSLSPDHSTLHSRAGIATRSASSPRDPDLPNVRHLSLLSLPCSTTPWLVVPSPCLPRPRTLTSGRRLWPWGSGARLTSAALHRIWSPARLPQSSPSRLGASPPVLLGSLPS
jgi:hypothetical protein